MTLFDFGLEYQALKDLIDNDLEVNQETGEIIDNSEQINELFNGLEMSFEDKLDNTQRYILTLQGEQEILDKEIKRLQAKKTALKNKESRLKGLILSTLQFVDKAKFKTPLYSFFTRKTKAVSVTDADSLARKYLKIKYEADKTKIKEDISNGVAVEGAAIVENISLGVK